MSPRCALPPTYGKAEPTCHSPDDPPLLTSLTHVPGSGPWLPCPHACGPGVLGPPCLANLWLSKWIFIGSAWLGSPAGATPWGAAPKQRWTLRRLCRHGAAPGAFTPTDPCLGVRTLIIPAARPGIQQQPQPTPPAPQAAHLGSLSLLAAVSGFPGWTALFGPGLPCGEPEGCAEPAFSQEWVPLAGHPAGSTALGTGQGGALCSLGTKCLS